MKQNLAIFEEHKIRRYYDEQTETWYFSVVDIVQVLIQQPDFQTDRKYWNKLKERLSKEGSEAVTYCHQLKMVAEDGKLSLTDTASVETLLHLIQSRVKNAVAAVVQQNKLPIQVSAMALDR